MPTCRVFTGATGLEPATSGVTGRYGRTGYDRLRPGITAHSRHFVAKPTGSDRLRSATTRHGLCSTCVLDLLARQPTEDDASAWTYWDQPASARCGPEPGTISTSAGSTPLSSRATSTALTLLRSLRRRRVRGGLSERGGGPHCMSASRGMARSRPFSVSRYSNRGGRSL